MKSRNFLRKYNLASARRRP